MKILVYGASSRIAHECARRWTREGHQVLLAGRDAVRLEAVRSDVAAVAASGSEPRVVVLDTADDAALRTGIARIDVQHGPVDVLLVAHGWLPGQAAAQADAGLLRRAVEANALSVAQIAEAMAGAMAARGHGCIAVIGSVAGDRGRQSNYVYGASKAFVERYCQGLRNRLHPAGVQVTLVKPGPTDTPMTRGMALPPGGRQPRLADPAAVARDIVRGIAQRRAVVYTPSIWRWIMLAVRSVPERLFVRLKL